MRVPVCLLVVMALGGVAAEAPNARAADTRRVYVITSVGDRGAPLAVQLRAQASGDEGFAAVFAAFGTGTQRAVDGVFATEFGDQSALRVGAGGQEIHSCAAGLGTCSVGQAPGTFTFRPGERSRIGPGTAVYIAVEAASVELTLGRGLRVRVVEGGLRRIVGGAADEAHVGLGRAHAARFTRAKMPGGRRGSVAVGAVPCEVRGEGEAGLYGEGSRLLTCGSSQNAAAFMSARFAVVWRLEGEVTGISMTRTRLAVVDLV